MDEPEWGDEDLICKHCGVKVVKDGLGSYKHQYEGDLYKELYQCQIEPWGTRAELEHYPEDEAQTAGAVVLEPLPGQAPVVESAEPKP